MNPHVAPRPRRLSRRSFLGVMPAAVGLVVAGGIRGVPGRAESTAGGDDGEALSPPEGVRPPTLKLPAFTSSGAKVPVTVEMSHPMGPGHYVTSIRVENSRAAMPLR